MPNIEEKLNGMGLTLPPAFDYPSPNRTGCVLAGGLVFVSGHPPPADFGVPLHGKVGGAVSEADAVAAARATALSILASVKREIGDLDRIQRVVKLFGMVNSAPEFSRQFAVIDGASDLYLELFGTAHARSAVGMFELPRDYCMEIEGIFQVNE